MVRKARILVLALVTLAASEAQARRIKISGQVVFALTERPVTRAAVKLLNQCMETDSTREMGNAMTGGDGRFTFQVETELMEGCLVIKYIHTARSMLQALAQTEVNAGVIEISEHMGAWNPLGNALYVKELEDFPMAQEIAIDGFVRELEKPANLEAVRAAYQESATFRSVVKEGCEQESCSPKLQDQIIIWSSEVLPPHLRGYLIDDRFQDDREEESMEKQEKREPAPPAKPKQKP